MSAPTMLPPLRAHARSVASGYPGRRSPPYISVACGNLAEVMAFVRQRVADSPDGALIVLREDEHASRGDYLKVDVLVHEDAPGLPFGPTQRAVARRACEVARHALDECFYVGIGRPR